jgi:putative phosphoesterase
MKSVRNMLKINKTKWAIGKLEVKIGIISDTHVRTIDEIPVTIRKALADVDIIIHAGDFTQKAVLDSLQSIAQVKAVHGNMDSIELKRGLPEREVFEASRKKVGSYTVRVPRGESLKG